MQIDKYYLYRHIRLDKYEPFYIGIGTKTKSDIKGNNYSRAIEKRRNNLWKKIINKTNYKIEILLESDNYSYIKDKEKEFIKLYGRKNLKTGSLANLTDGGEGETGRVCSEELRLKRSLILKERWRKIPKEERIEKTKFILEKARLAQKLLGKRKRKSPSIKREGRKVINTESKQIFNSMRDAYKSESFNICERHFRAMIVGKYENKTKFIIYNHV